jgi:Phosphoinositide phospholipase C, Ca2+-dependent
MLHRRTALTVLASAAVAVTGVTANSVTDAAGDRPGSGDVRFNQIQFVGAHNAYHRELSDKEKALQLSLDPGSKDIFYSHASIPDQLARQNVRSIELDLFPDPQGGLYRWPLIRKLAGLGPLTDPDLAKPGNKVLHIADFDYNTTCSTFVTCLRQIKTWQDANPGSAPVVVQVELKQYDPRIVAAGGVQSPPWNAANLRSALLNNETSRVGIALASGAQMVTTDFPVAGMSARYDRDFVVDLPGDGPLRCNPVTATRNCHLGK